jgi:hypothetical protein
MDFDPATLIDGNILRHKQLGFLRIEDASGGAGLHLAREGFYVCAESYSRPLKYNRTEASGWESFLPISAQDLADLQHILRYRWIVRETRRVIRRAAIRFEASFVLWIGDLPIALADGLSATIAGRAPTGLPDRLRVASRDGEDIELVVAEPRSSALIDTAIWPPRARRTAELVTLAVHRHMTGVEPSQEVFERDTAAVLSNRGAAALSDLLEQLDPGMGAPAPVEIPAPAPEAPPPPAASTAERDHVLMAWAMREMMPWLMKPVPPARAEYVFDELNTLADWAIIYDFNNGDVDIRPKPEALAATQIDSTRERAQYYLNLFKAASRLLPGDYKATLCVGVGDALDADYGVPVFCFQKARSDTSILLPDIDFLLSDYHLEPSTTDELGYDEKSPTAVFAGSTTGGTVTPEVAREYAMPRLRAAKFFSDSAIVDFRLPGIKQCSSAEAEAILRTNGFCQRPDLTWQQQFQHRFIISMDGNGATCSRVAIALRSNSVLMKYQSDRVLFYFGGLQPWLHYVPVNNDRHVERIIALETLMPGPFRHIAANSRAFAETFLSEDAIHRYTADLLTLYGRAIVGEEGPVIALASSHLRKSAPAAASTLLVGHIQNRGDIDGLVDEWVGDTGSTLAIEGFSITLPEDIPAEGFSYQAVLADGSLSEPGQNGEFRGTRGENEPIFGICVTAAGRFAETYDVSYEASFIDGSEIGPCAAGTVCKANTRIPLEAFRLSITDRVKSDREAAYIGQA